VFDPSDRDALMVWDTAEFFSEFMLFFTAFNVFLVLMGTMTLCVGGLGVSNIMYVVVRERTREIGIKRAVGANRKLIMAQFFAETFFITLLGAAIGFVIAWGITRIGAVLPDSAKEALGTPRIDPLVALVSIAIIAAIGFIAGFFPARKASRLDPIECLRY
jgi:putative ABC transport system permease protein